MAAHPLTGLKKRFGRRAPAAVSPREFELCYVFFVDLSQRQIPLPARVMTEVRAS
jgi:hypothetical protein